LAAQQALRSATTLAMAMPNVAPQLAQRLARSPAQSPTMTTNEIWLEGNHPSEASWPRLGDCR